MLEQNHNEPDSYMYYGTNLPGKAKRNKGLIYIIIGCVIFTILCVTITVLAIWNRNNLDADYAQRLSTEKLKKAMEQMKVGGLSDRYKQNDLDTIYYLEHIGQGRNNHTEKDENTTKLTIKYMAIKGLKNKGTENKINSKISEEMVKLYTNEEINNPSVDYVSINGYITGNYANTLSVYLQKSTRFIENNQIQRQGKSINIDLNTGDEIPFEDLFLPGIGIKNILSQVVYDNLVEQYIRQGIVVNNSVEVTGIEDRVYNTISKYSKGAIKEFYFTSSDICFELDNGWYTFPMWKYYDKIGIYTRYKTSNDIFDGTHKSEQENFIFQEIKDELVNQKISDNFIAIIITPYNLKNRSEYFVNKFNEFYDAAKIKVQNLKKEADANKDQTIVYACKINIDAINNYWSYLPEGQMPGSEKKSNFLDDFEVCVTSQNDSIIRISNKDYKDKLINEMYKRNYGIEKFADITVDELFSLVGNKAKIEFSNIDKKIVELTTNKSVEEVIDEQFTAKANEINTLIQDNSQNQDIAKIESKVMELKENAEILEGKFLNASNEKVNEIVQRNKQVIESFEHDIYNLKLKKEIIDVFDNQIKELNSNKQDSNISMLEEKSYYLAQVINTYAVKNKYDNAEIRNLIMGYSRDIVSLQEWAIQTRQKKADEERRKQEESRRQNQINNNINNTITTNTIDTIETVNITNELNDWANTNTTNTITNDTTNTITDDTNSNTTNEVLYTTIEL